MENIDVVGVLNQGLPGLVFLLSLLAFWLLTREQQKGRPNSAILKSIRHFMYINIFLALFTFIAPAADRILSQQDSQSFAAFDVKAKLGATTLKVGSAAVCVNADYANRHLLLKDKNTGNAIQVYAETVVPCVNGIQISLNQLDAFNLGWSADVNSSQVEVIPAMPGTKFIL